MEALCQTRQLLANDLLHAGVLETDGIDHACRALCNTGRGIAEAGILGGTLKGKGAKAVDIVKLGKFIAVAEGTRCGDHGIVKLDTAKGNLGVYFSHMISSFTSTGPSLQIRLLPVTVLQEQPMQAPKPQPMRSSKLN